MERPQIGERAVAGAEIVDHTYLAIAGTAGSNTFNDVTDLLLDITGATGAIGAGNFI